MTILPENLENERTLLPMFSSFMKEFKLNQLFRKCHINKKKGLLVKDVFQMIFLLVFTGKSFPGLLQSRHPLFQGKKDTFYRFLQKTSGSWRKLLFLLSTKVVTEALLPFTGLKRYTWVVDDSPYERPRSLKVEGLFRFYDHSQGRFSRGFRMLTLGLTDGATFIPFAFSLLSSHHPKNQLYPMDTSIDGRSKRAHLRKESQEKAPEVLLKLLDGALKHCPLVSTILFDSWFSFPALIRKCAHRGLSVVCMLKNTPKIYYSFGGKVLSLSSLFNRIPKRPQGPILGSGVINLNLTGTPLYARIVFVRSEKQKSQWLALLSTDLTLSEEEIVTLYGKRWDIEVFFKMTKSFLKLAREFQVRSYDALVSHTSIVFIRYIMLAVIARRNTDPRTFGELFYTCCDEIQDMTLMEALTLLLELLKTTIKQIFVLPEEKVKELVAYFVNSLPAWLKGKMPLLNCES
ncbi:MAG: hypothetical protein PWP04_1495 [Candidatus Atribacteria bacterium]|nr:hypothetical protein [Candidatus Atribacteria bacterium]